MPWWNVISFIVLIVIVILKDEKNIMENEVEKINK